MSKFANALKEYRLKNKLSQEEVALKLGTSKQVISRYEKDQRSPKISTAARFAQILGISVEDLFDDAPIDTTPWHTPLTTTYAKSDIPTREAACRVLKVDYVPISAADRARYMEELRREYAEETAKYAQPFAAADGNTKNLAEAVDLFMKSYDNENSPDNA